MTDRYQEQKAARGALATWIFILSAAYFFVSNGGPGSLISLQALVFFVAGGFAAAMVIGIPAYLLQRGVAKVLVKSINDPFASEAVSKIKTIGFVLMLIQIAVTFFAARFAYELFIV